MTEDKLKIADCVAIDATEVTCPYCGVVEIIEGIEPGKKYVCDNVYCCEWYIMGDC